MTVSRHVICPSCNATNRLPADRLAAGPKVARQPGAMGAADIVRWVKANS